VHIPEQIDHRFRSKLTRNPRLIFDRVSCKQLIY
jgi:hypothetical protein